MELLALEHLKHLFMGAHMVFTIPLLLAYGFKVMRRIKVVGLCIILLLILINNFESMLYFYHFAVSNYSL